jgi:hypothetical protein
LATVYQQLDPGSAQFLSSSFPALVKNGTNFPIAGLAYDAAADEAAFWHFRAVRYGSGNLTATVEWYADTASSGDVVWGTQLAAITPNTDTQDVETKALATANTATDTHLGTTGQRLHTIDVTISNLDSLALDDAVWLRVYRDADAAGDTMTGDAILTLVTVSYSDT